MPQEQLYQDLLKEYESQMLRYQALIDASPDGILLFTPIRNGEGIVIDFHIAHFNTVGAVMGSIPPDARSKSLLTILPHLKDSEQFEMHRQVLLTGHPIQFETTFRDEAGKEYGWFIVSLMKLEGSVFSRFIDISEKKKTEERFVSQAAFYNGILEASINGVFAAKAIKDSNDNVMDFIITKVNRAFTDMTGKAVVEAEGQSLLTIFPGAIDNETFKMYAQVAETGLAIRKEMKGAAQKGNWYDVSVAKIGADAIAVTFTDISKRMKAFAEVEDQRNLLNNILQHSPSGIAVSEVIRDETGEVTDAKIIMANELMGKFMGFSKEEMLNQTARELDPNLDESGLLQMAGLTLFTGEPFRTQYFFEAQKIWIELGVSKMDNNRLVNIFSDITAPKQFQLKLENTVDKLRRTNASLEEFTYAASHDLKEPIRKIRIFAERLKMIDGKSLSEEGHKLLDKLLTSGTRMSMLVDDLLNYSHVSLVRTIAETIDLNELLHSVISDLELEVEEKKASIKMDDLPAVTGHRRQLQQLFQNLLANALKYNREGVAPVISITCGHATGKSIDQEMPAEEKEKSFLKIAIADNGIGFEQKNVLKIFRVFQRLHNRSQYGGSGIGLSIVKRVVENHNGYITASGKENEGAVFTIYLPVG